MDHNSHSATWQDATDCKVITFTIAWDYIIQRHQCTARCRRKSIHVTNSRHESAKTRLYNIKGLQTCMRISKICHVVSGGYMKRDHLTRLCQSTHKTNQNEIFGISTWVHVMSKHTSAVQKSTMLSAEVIWRGITWPDRDHMTWLCHSTHETKRRARYSQQTTSNVCVEIEHALALCNMQCVTCNVL